MSEKKSVSLCLNCACSENDFPLVSLRFQAKDFYICPQCMPTLIHHPEKLKEKLAVLKPSHPRAH